MPARIPCHIITGFLGTGKTTAILQLLAGKPEGERWAVLVNEFGEIGIDGAMLQGQGAIVREVAGGCMCCAAGLPTQVALNLLLGRGKPDRLLIEPTGLGHPAQILRMLEGEYYRDLLEPRAVITLVDPGHLAQPRYRDNTTFQDQVALADVLVGHKADRFDEMDRAAFKAWAEGLTPRKQAIGWCSHGQLDPAWLELPRTAEAEGADAMHHHSPSSQETAGPGAELPAGEDFLRREAQGLDHHACGWLFSPETCFDFDALFSLFNAQEAQRLKAVMITDQGVFAFNAEGGVLSVRELDDALDSRVELIHPQLLDWNELEQALLRAVSAPEPG